jgi:hypothetical protein
MNEFEHWSDEKLQEEIDVENAWLHRPQWPHHLEQNRRFFGEMLREQERRRK